MNPIPSVDDWKTDPIGALAASKALADKTVTDAGASPTLIALGIAAQVLTAAAPLVGTALAGPLGGAAAALAAAAVHQAATELGSEHSAAMTALTPEEQGLVTAAISVGVAAVTKKVTP